MSTIHAIAGGMGLLILAYLMFKNPDGVKATFGGAKDFTVGDIQALQGR